MCTELEPLFDCGYPVHTKTTCTLYSDKRNSFTSIKKSSAFTRYPQSATGSCHKDGRCDNVPSNYDTGDNAGTGQDRGSGSGSGNGDNGGSGYSGGSGSGGIESVILALGPDFESLGGYGSSYAPNAYGKGRNGAGYRTGRYCSNWYRSMCYYYGF